jgi:argininosuccinate lyase
MLTDRSLSKEKIQENMNYLMMINSNKTVSENHLEQIAQALERMNCIKEPLLKELPIVK